MNKARAAARARTGIEWAVLWAESATKTANLSNAEAADARMRAETAVSFADVATKLAKDAQIRADAAWADVRKT